MTLVPLEQTITSNGTFTFNPADYSGDGFSAVTIIVNVPQTVTTGYLLKNVYGYNDSASLYFTSPDVDQWQNSTTVTVYGDSNRRVNGTYMYYDSTDRKIYWVNTGSYGGVSITFSATQYFIRQATINSNPQRPYYIRLYDINSVNVAELGMLSIGSYVTIPANIVVNL